jgi:hypothetical protein
MRPASARRKKESAIMRLLFTSFSFLATMVIGAIAFAATAINFPAIMRDLIAYAQQLPGYLANLGIGPEYLVWVDILLTGDKLVLLGFILVARILVAILSAVVINGNPPRASFAPTQGYGKESAFHGWGKQR